MMDSDKTTKEWLRKKAEQWESEKDSDEVIVQSYIMTPEQL